MLVVAKPDRVAQVQAIAAKWELDATPIGRVTDDGMYRCRWKDQVVVEIPGRPLVEDAPVYHPGAQEDAGIARLRSARPTPHTPLPTPGECFLRLLDDPSIASKRWVFEQYDSTVQASTVIAPGGDAGVLRVRGEPFGLAVSTDGNARYVLLDPYEGGKAAVAEAARNVACTGARPLGITNCLNFGSPERPGVFYQFKEACRGIADACRALGTPVSGGNVSFYNESPGGAVDPTPVIGMVGLLTRVDHAVPSFAGTPGDAVLILGETRAELGGSALWASVLGCVLVVVSMGCFALGASTETLALVFGALVLSGLGLGTSQPSLISSAANAVETESLGVANAAQVMVTQIGVVSGIQVVSTIQGGSSSTGSFTLAYLAGGIIAVVGIVGAAFVQSADRPARLRMAQAA